jgi:two-component system, LytTR family, sensor kinase
VGSFLKHYKFKPLLLQEEAFIFLQLLKNSIYILMLTIQKKTLMKFSRKTAAVITLFAFFIQLVIIIYNHLTGFVNLSGITEFLIRISIGTFFSTIFGIFIVYIDLKIINLLDRKFSWIKSPVKRLLFELTAAVFAGVFIGTTVTVTVHIPFPFDDLLFNVVNNSLITIIINLILIVSLEAFQYFKRHQFAQVKGEKLQKENAQIRLELLKNQLNPHFLFNSLNVLSALIQKDTGRAQQFIEEFSSIYRYTLDVIDKPVVELKEEIDFAKSYLFLQQIRFENSVKYNINIDAKHLSCFIPPLAVQAMLENALKHNRTSKESPLCIDIYNEGDNLFITNNIQAKVRNYVSTGLGLDNLKKRYSFVADEEPEFNINADKYIARLPLIKPD